MVFPAWIETPPMTLLKVGWIAARHDTEMAHAAVHAVAVEMAERGRAADDPVGLFSDPGVIAVKPIGKDGAL